MADPVAQDRWTVAAYLAMERASETKHMLWDGELFSMAGASRRHNWIAVRATTLLMNALQGKRCRPFNSDQRLAVPSTGRYTYPDASVYCPPIIADVDDPHTVRNPTVVIEVLSESTEKFDRGAKFAGYRSIAALKDYLLIAQEEVRVEHYSRQANDTWLLTVYGAGASITLASIEVEISVDGLYEGAFDEPMDSQ